MTQSSVALVSAVILLTVGTQFARAEPSPAPPKTASPQAAAPAPAAELRPEDRPPYRFRLDQLTPIKSGPGVIVFHPVCPPGADKDLRYLSMSCSAWLYITVGGCPEFGKTPALDWAGLAAAELNFKDFRLPAPQAIQVCGAVGATHAIVGSCSSSQGRITLKYQIWEAPRPSHVVETAKPAGKKIAPGRSGAATPAGKPLGAPFVISGAPDQIAAALPDVARKMVERLGGESDGIPNSLSLSADDLIFIRRIRLEKRESFREADVSRLQALLPRDPLAGIAWLQTPWLADEHPFLPVVRDLLGATPENAVVWWAAGSNNSWSYQPYLDQIKQLADRYPKNHLFAEVQIRSLLDSPDIATRARAAQRMVQSAPDDPMSRALLSGVITDAAEFLRQARLASEITPEEWQVLGEYYARWLQVTQKLAHLAPRYGYAWSQVAVAATFGGSHEQATRALWRANKLSPELLEAYTWGLEMFQPKWGGTPEELEKIAALSMKAPLTSPNDLLTLARELQSAGFAARAKTMTSRALEAARKGVGAAPQSGPAHYILALAYLDQGNRSDAISELRKAISAQPDRADIVEFLGAQLFDDGATAEAEAFFRQAEQLAPGHASIHYYLTEVLSAQRKYAEAEKEINEAVRMAPTDALYAYWQGEIFKAERRFAAAVPCYQTAVHFSPRLGGTHLRLAELYQSLRKFPDEEKEALLAIQANSQNGAAHMRLAAGLLYQGKFDDALTACDDAIRLLPREPYCHLLKGRAYFGQGKNAEARKEWETVIALDPNNPNAAVARNELQNTSLKGK